MTGLILVTVAVAMVVSIAVIWRACADFEAIVSTGRRLTPIDRGECFDAFQFGVAGSVLLGLCFAVLLTADLK